MSNSIVIPFVVAPGPPGAGALVALADAAPSGGVVQAINGVWVPCDVRTGPVQVTAPVAPQEGWLFAVADIYGQSGVNPILIAAVGVGITIANPSWSGIGSPYGTSATVASALGVQMWRFSAALQQWRLA